MYIYIYIYIYIHIHIHIIPIINNVNNIHYCKHFTYNIQCIHY